MITLEKVEFWLRHRQHPDIVDRGSAKERAVVTSSEWTLLEELVSRLRLAQQGLTSPEFREKTEQELLASVADRQTAETLRKIAAEAPSK